VQQRYIDENSNICPYCKKNLPFAPDKNMPCPFCGNMIFVRESRYGKEKVLLTGEKDAAIGAQGADWEAINFVKKMLDTVKGSGITESGFHIRKNELQRKLERPPTDIEVLRDIFTGLQPQGISVYNQLALLLNREKRDASQLLYHARQKELANLKGSGIVKKVKIISGVKAGDTPLSCPECAKIQGKIFTIDQALRDMPLPNIKCTCKVYDEIRGFCRCVYTAVV
jgi:predicted RNA-binding Zn-ribbon protein involved in translation (DUF1610 family)